VLSQDVRDFRGVQAVYPARGMVVYLMDPDPGGPRPMQWYSRRYELSANGGVEWKGDPVQCRPSMRYEAMAAEAADTAASDGGCGCKKATGAATGAADNEEKAMHRNAQRIKALVDHAKTPWQEADTAYLEGLTDERLAEFEKAVPAEEAAKVETKEEPKVESKAAAAVETKVETQAEPKVEAPKTLAEVDMKALPKPVQDHFAKLAARETAQRTELITALKSGQDVISEDELKTYSLDQLVKVAKLAGLAAEEDDAVDFGVLGAHRATKETDYTPPDPWEAGLKKLAAARG
jgi:hypothetical protein